MKDNINQKYQDKIEDLTEFEKAVIVDKATEPPFTSSLLEEKRDGLFVCKLCKTPLFRSSAKFNSGTGWPSFDEEIEGAVKRLPDADGRRVEIVCATCGGHLGHVFEGEGFTSKMTRHCVNGVSLEFKATK